MRWCIILELKTNSFIFKTKLPFIWLTPQTFLASETNHNVRRKVQSRFVTWTGENLSNSRQCNTNSHESVVMNLHFKMHIPLLKLLKGRKMEKGCWTIIYVTTFSCLVIYNKDRILKSQTPPLKVWKWKIFNNIF